MFFNICFTYRLWVLECRWFVYRHCIRALCLGRMTEEKPPEIREESWRPRHVFRPPLPTILLANVQSLDNKLWELRALISFQRETRDVCNGSRLSHQAQGVLRAPLEQNESAHREKQRWGHLFLYQQLVVWWKEHTLYSILLLPWSGISYASVSTILATEGIYSHHNHGCLYPPQANTDQALRELYGNISEQESAHPDAAFVVTGTLIKPTSEK